ncbi:MAG: hypothetical protein WBX25_17355 [Rhodomicrobium sp.]
MKIVKALLVGFVFAGQAGLAHADSVSRNVGNARYDFAIPRGHCALDEGVTQDASFARVIRTLLKGAQNTMILASVECTRLKRFRNGDRGNILDYSTYYTPDSYVQTTLDGDNQTLRKQLCNDMRKQGQDTLAGVKDIVAKKAKELKANIGVTSTAYIGVLDEDEHGCYAALLVGVKGATGEDLLMSSIVTSTVIRKKPLFLAIYAKYTGPEVTQNGVQLAKGTAADLDRLNH